jgi:4-hydroxythreonine-4-phosphate dehydrogenase
MGTPEMYVALFTEHIPLRKVADEVQHEKLHIFLKNLLVAKPDLERVGVLGLNPHSGDGGVLGNEERIIENVVRDLNREIGREIFSEPLVPDIAFTPHMRAKYKFYVAIYHDQGLIPLKTLYFHESINISLNLPIVRTSVGHGTAFDIAYKKDRVLDGRSYINAIKEAIL